MKKVNVEKFLADYENALKEKEEMVVAKENALNEVKNEVEVIGNERGLSEFVRNGMLELLTAEKEKEFDLGAVDGKIAKFEEYLEEVAEEVAPVEDTLIEETATEPKFDAFGNPIVE